MTRSTVVPLGFSLGLLLAACADGGSTDDGCESGLQGCSCISGGLCVGGLICVEGICEPESGAEDEVNADGDSGKPLPDFGGDTSDSSTGDGDTGAQDGTCVNFCGGVGSNESCYCDTSCTELGDCCPDYAAACPGQCLSNFDCATDEVCSSSTQTCGSAYGSYYRVWVEEWTDNADVCWDADSCYSPDPFYTINVGGFNEFTSNTVSDTGSASWADDPAILKIDGNQSLYIRMEDEDLVVNDWILTWGPENGQGQYVAPPISMLRDGYVYEDCWQGQGNGCYVLAIRFVAY